MHFTQDEIYKVRANSAALYLWCVSDFGCHVLSYSDVAFGGDRARCWCLIAYGKNMTQHESKTDPSLLKHYCSFIQGEDHITCSSVAKTQSVSNLSKIPARDSSAYPSVTTQRVIFSCLSHSGSTSNLKRVFASLCVFVCVCLCHFHTWRSTPNRLYVEKECSPAKASNISSPHHYTLSPAYVLSTWSHWILIAPKARLIICVGTFYLATRSLVCLMLQETHCMMHLVQVVHIWNCICLSCVSAVCTCVRSLYPLSSSIHVPFDSLKNKQEGSLPQGQTLNYHTMPSMAGDLQIISIDHGSDHTECRADSKITST